MFEEQARLLVFEALLALCSSKKQIEELALAWGIELPAPISDRKDA